MSTAEWPLPGGRDFKKQPLVPRFTLTGRQELLVRSRFAFEAVDATGTPGLLKDENRLR